MAMGAEMEFPKTAEGEHATQVTLRVGGHETVCQRLSDEDAKPVLAAMAADEKRVRENKPDAGSEAAVRKLIADIQAGKPDTSMFADGGERFVQQLQPQIAQMGTVKTIKFLQLGPGGMNFYTVESDKGTWLFRVWMTEDGKVQRAIVTPAQGQ